MVVRFSQTDNTLWKRIPMSVHNIKGLKALKENFQHAAEGLCAYLSSNDYETSMVRTIIEDGLTLKVGSGESILFWHDSWCNEGPL